MGAALPVALQQMADAAAEGALDRADCDLLAEVIDAINTAAYRGALVCNRNAGLNVNRAWFEQCRQAVAMAHGELERAINGLPRPELRRVVP